jgi:Glycosyl hydrolases family 16
MTPPGDRLPSLDGYRLEFAEEFDGADLDLTRWLPAHLPQWSSRAQAAARYRLGDGRLVLQIVDDQPPWCPEFDGATKVSSLQTGVYAGAVGSAIGQHRFNPRAVVREPQPPARLYTPLYGYFEMRAKALADPATMAALWMIGYEDAPERSGEICICEIFGSDVDSDTVRVGMGIHPFGDPELTDDFSQVPLTIDATDFHVYGAEWSPTHVDFFVDGRQVKSVPQSPSYPMQLMLGVYEFDADSDVGTNGAQTSYPKEFVVDYVRVYQPVAGYAATDHA